uniref:RING-type domain-containing protein n=1 Tax=Panagrolaimus sp. PS1159 TaxID=55785 RepID=A0AC35GV67_9BILA
MNWSRQLSHEPMYGETPQLSEQLANAKTMGFSDNEIMAAIAANNKHNKNKVFAPFRSTDHMVEILSDVQKENTVPQKPNNEENNSTKPSSPLPPPRYLSLDRYRNRSSDEDAENVPYADSSPSPILEKKFPPKWTSSVITPRSASVNRSASFTNSQHTYTTSSPLLRRPISGYYLPTLGGSTTSLTNAINNGNINSNNNLSAVSRLIETFNNERKGLIEEFSKAIDVLKRKNKDYLNDQSELKTKIGNLEAENEKLQMQLRDRTMLEERYERLENTNKQLNEQLEEKNNEISEYESQIQTIPNLETELHEIRQQKNEKENECDEYRNQIDALQCELRYLSEPADVISELQAELIQLKMENKDYREKQSIHACTTCMDQPRNVLFMPCLHFTCCSSCAYKTEQCSICRMRIMGKVEVYQ